MKKKTTKKSTKNGNCSCKTHHGYEAGGLYFVGFIGAAVYYISNATGFWNGVLGFLKSLIWPAIIVHGLLNFLGL